MKWLKRTLTACSGFRAAFYPEELSEELSNRRRDFMAKKGQASHSGGSSGEFPADGGNRLEA